MLPDHPLIHSKVWYEFMSEQGQHDPEVRRQIAIYMDARAKLNKRLLELAKSNPKLNLASKCLSDGDTLSDGLMQQVKEYLELHTSGKKSIESICDDARAEGFELIHISES
jgi:hypothetical protein